MFRLDEEFIIDATRMGGMARFINHACEPNCVAQIISHEGKKKVGIYSKREINTGEELTYDYKFQIEAEGEKIKCYCGSTKCRLFMN